MTLVRRRSPPARRLAAWPPRFRGLRAVVWGDFVLDEYWRCRSSRVSREAPVLVLDYLDRAVQGGGAANAALNLAALGAKVSAVGCIGSDAAGEELRVLLSRAGVDVRGVVASRSAATVVKTRVVAGGPHLAQQQVVRIDRGRSFTPDGATRARMRAAVLDGLGPPRRSARGATRGSGRGVAPVLVVSDYGYDSVTPAALRAARRDWSTRDPGAKPVIAVDARYRLAQYRDVTLATPNESEAAAASGITIDGDRDLARAARRLRARTRATHLIVTRGRDGLTLWSGREAVAMEAWGGHEAVDVTGAGDAVVATSALALAAGASPIEAAALANVAGSVAVSRRGAVAVTARELQAALAAGTRA